MMVRCDCGFLKYLCRFRVRQGRCVSVSRMLVNSFSFASLAGGLIDANYITYDTNNGSNGIQYALAVQSDGKIVIGGSFTVFNGFEGPGIIRLNSDGTKDTTFAPTGSGEVRCLAVQSDGKILVGGQFLPLNGTTGNDLIRLNSDGTTDTAFTTNIGSAGGSAIINAIVVQSDGKIIVAGQTTSWNGVTVGRIVRLNSDGTRDTAFTTNNGTGGGGAGSEATTIAVQSDGKIIVGGTFTTWNGTTVNRIVRLNSDGTRDTTFTTNVGTAANNPVNACAVQSDGKIIVVGAFSSWNGTVLTGIVRLNTDGTRDVDFTTNVAGGGSNGRAIVFQSDGKIVIAGSFSLWSGVTVNRIVRLNADGSRDTTFTTNTGTAASSEARSAAIQSDGKIIVGGVFVTWDNVTVNRIVRLNSDGTRDTSIFSPSYASNNNVSSIGIQSDGSSLIGGSFTRWNETTVPYIVKLNSDGTRDTAFNTTIGTGPSNTISVMRVQSDGKTIIGGNFATWNGTTVNRIVRLNSDGTRDVAFNTNTGTAGGSSVVGVLAIQSDGKILAAGPFTSWNGTAINRIVRLNSDGTLDTGFITNAGTAANSSITTIVIQSDGKIILGGFFTTWNSVTVNRVVRLNSDGTRDTGFTTNAGTAANSSVNTISVQSDGKIIIGGAFATWNGVTVNAIVRLNSDGTRDTGFTTNTGTGTLDSFGSLNVVNVSLAQLNGKTIIGGNFSFWNNVRVGRIVRLNADGTRDTTFTANTGDGATGAVSVIAPQSDGRLIIGGSFTGWNNAVRSYIARIGGE